MGFNNNKNNQNNSQPVRTLTSTSNIVLLTDVILEVATNSPTSVFLPTPSNSGFTNNVGKMFVIKDSVGTAATSAITIRSTGSTIDGTSFLQITTNYGFYQIISDGSNYYSVATPSQSAFTPTQNIIVFTSPVNFSTNYSPSANLQYAVVEVIGGGGGAGGVGSPSSATAAAGGGGGGGEYARGAFSAAMLSSTAHLVVIGGGGSGGVGVTGTAGGQSSFGNTSAASVFISANGGSGGVTTSIMGRGGAGGTGGTGAGTSFRVAGPPGLNGTAWYSFTIATISGACGGNGGSTFFGGGGVGANPSTVSGQAGGNGNGYGAGGGGGAAVNLSPQSNGGTGAGGAVIITEYIFAAPLLSTTASSFSWNVVSGTTQTMAASNGYYTTNSSLTTLTLPLTSSAGALIEVQGFGAGGWTIAQNAGQQISYGNQQTTVGTGGFLSSANQYDGVQLIAVSSLQFVVMTSVGNIVIN